MLVNTLTVDGKYPVQDGENWQLPIQTQLSSEKGKKNHNFVFSVWNLAQILKILKKKMIVIANAFPKLDTAKMLLTPLSKKPRFRTRINIQHVKPSQTLAKSP